MALTREHGRYGKIMEVFIHLPIWQFLAIKHQYGDFECILAIFGKKAPMLLFPVKSHFWPKGANVPFPPKFGEKAPIWRFTVKFGEKAPIWRFLAQSGDFW